MTVICKLASCFFLCLLKNGQVMVYHYWSRDFNIFPLISPNSSPFIMIIRVILLQKRNSSLKLQSWQHGDTFAKFCQKIRHSFCHFSFIFRTIGTYVQINLWLCERGVFILDSIISMLWEKSWKSKKKLFWIQNPMTFECLSFQTQYGCQ